MRQNYHLPCLGKLINRYCGFASKSNNCPENIDGEMDESHAFIELQDNIEKCVESGVLLLYAIGA